MIGGSGGGSAQFTEIEIKHSGFRGFSGSIYLNNVSDRFNPHIL